MRHIRNNLFLCLLLLLAMAARAQQASQWDAFEKAVYTNSQGKSLPYRLLKPLNYDPAKKYPLVLFLHGSGEKGNDNQSQLKNGVETFLLEERRKKYPCFVVVPQCPGEQDWLSYYPPGKGRNIAMQDVKLSEQATLAMSLALELLDDVQKKYAIDNKRLYLTGISLGGGGTLDLIMRKPNLFAAAVPVCGWGDVSKAPLIAHIPVWLFHGSNDQAVYPLCSQQMFEALKKANGNARYTEYAGVGHDSWVKAYREEKLIKWLFSQKKQ